MRIFVCFWFCIFFNGAYALYGQSCSEDLDCEWETRRASTGVNEVCIKRRCGCKDHTRLAYSYSMKPKCDEWSVERCSSNSDCGDRRSSHKTCTKKGICECDTGYIYIEGSKCYKIDEPSPRSFLKNCTISIGRLSELSKYNEGVPFCHPEDKVFCTSFLRYDDVYITGKCVCYPGYYYDRNYKMCLLISEYLRFHNVLEYKMKPEDFCHSDTDCIVGLDCKDNFCQCPDGCVYKSNNESCDCGSYYDSDAYWEQSYAMPSFVGTISGIAISSLWGFFIFKTFVRMSPDKDEGENEDAQALNPLPTQVNQSVSVPVVGQSCTQSTPYEVGTAPIAGDTPNYSPLAPPHPTDSETLPYSLGNKEKSNPSIVNPSSYNMNPLPYAPQPCNIQPYGPQTSAPALNAPVAYSEPPPSYSEAVAQDAP